MTRKQISIYVLLFIILGLVGLIASFGGTVAMAADSTNAVSNNAATVNVGSGFTYQGLLRSGGNPVSGTCDLRFSLWDADSGGLQIGGTQTVANVTVIGGAFTVLLNNAEQFGEGAFNGQARWLEIAVNCGNGFTTLSPRQALTPTPYALSLRPGAVISRTGLAQPGPTLTLINSVEGFHPGTGLSVEAIGVGIQVASSGGSGISIDAADGSGLYVAAAGNDGVHVASAGDRGGHFEGNTAGIYVRSGSDAAPDIILGGNGSSNDEDNGRIVSPPNFAGSDIYLTSNDSVVVQLDQDNSGEDADFNITNADGATIFNVDNNTGVTVRAINEVSGSDLTLAGISGRLISDPNNIYSDLYFGSNGDVVIQLDRDNSFDENCFTIVGRTGNTLFNICDPTNLSETPVPLSQKVEELTLYLDEIDARLQALEQENALLREALNIQSVRAAGE